MQLSSGVRVGSTEIYCLVYADDMVIFSENSFVLQNMLDALVDYCKTWHLTINESKSKVMVFRKGGRLARYDRFHINGKSLDIVNSFKYLGINFSTNGTWSSARSLRVDHANKLIFTLKRSPVFKNLPPHLKMYVFDIKILPTLLYASEVWGENYLYDSKIDNVLYKFCKYVLGLPRYCVNATAIAEIGRSRISIYASYRKVKFWLQILKHSNSRYTSISYKPIFEMANNGISCWANDVKQILSNAGYGDIWCQQGANSSDDRLFLCNFLQRLVDIDKQIWSTNINAMSRLYLYRNFKSSNSYEFYLAHVDSWFHRTTLSKFRCGCFDLEVNKGRRIGTPRDMRLCTLCNLSKVEDEFHFLLECPIYYELRLLYLPRYFFTSPTLQKFACLLNTTNKNLLYKISKFLIQARRYRAELIYIES